MKTPKVNISWGELFDKITILEIKLKNLKTMSALKNVKKEHYQLYRIFHESFAENATAQADDPEAIVIPLPLSQTLTLILLSFTISAI